MGILLKDRNGNVLVRPVNHAMTDAQAKTAVENAIEDGTVTSYLGIPCTNPVILSSSDGINIVTGEYCDPSTGIIYDSSSYSSFVRSDYLPVAEVDVVRVTWGRHYVFFDSDKDYVSGGDISSLTGYTGTQEENFITIPSGVAYLIINFYPAYNLYGVTLESKTDPEIVIMGDSIYGIAPYPFNPVYYASAEMRRNIADCALVEQRQQRITVMIMTSSLSTISQIALHPVIFPLWQILTVCQLYLNSTGQRLKQ